MIETYAFKYENNDVLLNSSSGGAFTAISDYVLSMNGVVYGAIYCVEKNLVFHVRATDKNGRNLMRGSKYLQSKIGDAYLDVFQDLKNKKLVLFSGTACQIAGLKQYLHMRNMKTNNLITVDIICHGVGSPLIWKDFIEFKYSKKLCSINFRSKVNGWKDSIPCAYAEDKCIDLSEYMKLFYAHVIMRPACHSCAFTSISRCSEITIGDFWGIENLDINFSYRDGVSFVMINNEKGQSIIEKVFIQIPDVISKKVELTDVIQPNLYTPTKPSVIRKRFWSDYKKRGVSYICKKYASESLMYKVIVILQKIFYTILNKRRV